MRHVQIMLMCAELAHRLTVCQCRTLMAAGETAKEHSPSDCFGKEPMTDSALLNIAYTPDSDDAFYYYALETGRVPMPGFLPEFLSRPISALNQAALDGTYEVT